MATAIALTTEYKKKEKTQVLTSANPNAADTDVAISMTALNDLTDNTLKKVEKITKSGIDFQAFLRSVENED